MLDDFESDNNNGRSSAAQPLLPASSHTRNSSSSYSLAGAAATTTGRDADTDESKSIWKRCVIFETPGLLIGMMIQSHFDHRNIVFTRK
jgi:zona occludens toxin (predicted ATPase)